jgi:hypothetical protein
MTVWYGLIIAVGVVLTAYGLAMLVDYRGLGTSYWEGVFKWNERWNPLWRSSPRPTGVARRSSDRMDIATRTLRSALGALSVKSWAGPDCIGAQARRTRTGANSQRVPKRAPEG